MASSGKEVHLVILIHGLWGESPHLPHDGANTGLGSPAHLAVAKEELEAAYAEKKGIKRKKTTVDGPEEDPTVTTTLTADIDIEPATTATTAEDNEEGEAGEAELVVVIAGGMTSQLTYDGIDVCASRVAWEVDQQVAEIEGAGKRVTRFSITGYSLGGLVARYLVGLLHSRTPSFFEAHRPVTFSTIATPHIGIPRYNTFLSGVLVWLGSRLLSRSGEQLYVADRYSDQDPRPLLEIMADPNLIFIHGLEQFQLIQVFANGVNDHTVPYPSAAIEAVDHFADYKHQNLQVKSDEDDIISSWSNSATDDAASQGEKKKWWQLSVGTLPPVLRFRFPFNYLILLLAPVMLPVIIILMISRLSLDTRRSQRRLQSLAQTSTSPTEVASPSSPIPTVHGLSVQSLRQAIRRVEREIESDLISNMDSPSIPINPQSDPMGEDPVPEVATKAILKDSQLRMVLWLNRLPLKKYITWYPDVANAHSVCVVRDPVGFPFHTRGRGLLKRWAKGVLSLD